MSNQFKKALYLTAPLFLVGCLGSEGAGKANRELRIELINPISGITEPSITSLTEGQFRATYTNTNTGESVDVTNEVEWSTSNSNTSINATGLLTSSELTPGKDEVTTVNAHYLNQYVSNSEHVDILFIDTLSDVNISPNFYQIPQGGDVQYKASAYFEINGYDEIKLQDISSSVTWSSDSEGPNNITVCNTSDDDNIGQDTRCIGKPTGYTFTDDLVDVESIGTVSFQHDSLPTDNNESTLFISNTNYVQDFDINLEDGQFAYCPKELGQAFASITTNITGESKVTDVTRDSEWHSENTNVVEVNNDAYKGRLTAIGGGKATIFARFSDQVMAHIEVTVKNQTITNLRIVPSASSDDPLNITIPENKPSRESFSVKAEYSGDCELSVPVNDTLNISSTNPDVAHAVNDDAYNFHIQGGNLASGTEAAIIAHYVDNGSTVLSSEPINVNLVPYVITDIKLSGTPEPTLFVIEEGQQTEPFTVLTIYNDGYDIFPVSTISNDLEICYNLSNDSNCDNVNDYVSIGSFDDTNWYFVGKKQTPVNTSIPVSFKLRTYNDGDCSAFGGVCKTDVSVHVTPATFSAPINPKVTGVRLNSKQKIASLLNPNVNRINKAQFRSAQNDIAQVEANSWILPNRVGNFTLELSSYGNYINSTWLRVTDAPIDSIRIELNESKQKVFAYAEHSDGVVTDLSDSAHWTSSNNESVSLTDSNVIVMHDGIARLQASFNGMKSNIITINANNIIAVEG
ncbi:hypothetical protein [Vibrio coralliirubri]|uniref:hypothetical protein n=1 Tax=Vibrio coralliirubri TaxID=1516159 RepID=UPI000EFD93A7|nr:hypothetical protein [Vibrio coralliirubri]